MSYSSRSSLFLKIKSISQHKSAFFARKFYGLAMLMLALLIFLMPPIHKVLSKLDFWMDKQVRSVYETSASLNYSIRVFKNNFAAIFQTGSAIARLKDENERLKSQVITLEAKNAEYSQLETVGKFVVPHLKHMLSTRLIVRSPNRLGTGKILAGELDGVSVGQFIVSGAGCFLGRVIETGDTSAKVLLITEPHSHLPVYFPRTQSKAILEGNYDGQLKIIFSEGIGTTNKLETGDAVVTASEDESIQPGLPVGRVMVQPGNQVRVVPIQDPKDLDVVSVAEVQR